jgi:predicted nucleotidyltransferase
MLTANDMERIGRRIVDRCNPWVVGVFGSHATGYAREGSDLDIFVIKPWLESKPARDLAVLRALQGVMYRVDVLTYTPQEFEEGAAEYMSFAWIVVRQAKFLHVAPEAAGLISRIDGWPETDRCRLP